MLKSFKFQNTWLFLLLAVIPTLVVIFYNLIIANPVYVSESKVIIKTIGEGQSSGLGSLLKSFGITESSATNAQIVATYIQSRDAMNMLNQKFKIKDYYSKNGDILSRFNPLSIDNSDENFFKYYQNTIVKVWVDSNSNIVVIQTRAFNGNMAYKLNDFLVKLTEDFVNHLNKRASITAMQYYEEQITQTKKKINESSKKLVSFFKETGIVAPETQIVGQVQLITELQKQLADKKIEYSRMKFIAPESPTLKTLENDIKRIESEINKNFSELIAHTGKHSVTFELLKTELQTLQSELNANISAYIQAQNQAFMKHLFIETVQGSTLPDKAMEPKRFKNIFTVFAIGITLWGVISLLIAGVKEHKGI